MILVDTSVWVDHFRRRHARLERLLLDDQVLCHPFVIGELACGNLRNRAEVIALLGQLAPAEPADDPEVLEFVERNRLCGSGLGWVDAHLLASTVLSGAFLWTLDRRLQRAAGSLRVAFHSTDGT
jgi:predicted nucleic acid-binding protein